MHINYGITYYILLVSIYKILLTCCTFEPFIIQAGLNLGKVGGFYGIPYSSDGKLTINAAIDKWEDKTYIFKVDEQIPHQLFCGGK